MMKDVMKSKNILITGLGSTTAISVIKGLKKQDEYKIRLVGTDTNERDNIAGSQFCDVFFKVPPASEERRYVESLCQVIEDESIDVLIPITDLELEVVAKNIDAFGDGIFILVSPYPTISLCNDKLKTYEFFLENEIPTVRTIAAIGEDIAEYVNRHGFCFPFIAKPNKGVSSRDTFIIQNSDELSLIRRIEEPILQEFAGGQEYTVDIFCCRGELLTAVPRRRIETRSGISYKGKTEKNEAMIVYIKKIVRALEILGPANVQCFVDGDKIHFIEINPRFSAGLPLTIEAGANTPFMALMLADSRTLEPIMDFKNVTMCRYWEEVYYYG